MNFVIKKSKDGQYYFNLVAGNGEVVATSETYTTKQSAKHTITSITSFFYTKALSWFATDEPVTKSVEDFTVDQTIVRDETDEDEEDET